MPIETKQQEISLEITKNLIELKLTEARILDSLCLLTDKLDKIIENNYTTMTDTKEIIKNVEKLVNNGIAEKISKKTSQEISWHFKLLYALVGSGLLTTIGGIVIAVFTK